MRRGLVRRVDGYGPVDLAHVHRAADLVPGQLHHRLSRDPLEDVVDDTEYTDLIGTHATVELIDGGEFKTPQDP